MAFQHLRVSILTQESYYNKIYIPQVIKLRFFIWYRKFYFIAAFCYLCSSPLLLKGLKKGLIY